MSSSQLTAPGGGCLRVQGSGFAGGRGGLVIAKCNTTDNAQNFTYDATTMQLSTSSHLCVDVHSGGPIVWMYGCSGGVNDKLKFDASPAAGGTISVAVGAGLCFGVEEDDPAGATFESSLQAWAKPLNGTNGVAVLMINPGSSAQKFIVPLNRLPIDGSGKNLTGLALSVRDVWKRAAGTAVAKGAATLEMTVGPMDSAFVRVYA